MDISNYKGESLVLLLLMRQLFLYLFEFSSKNSIYDSINEIFCFQSILISFILLRFKKKIAIILLSLVVISNLWFISVHFQPQSVLKSIILNLVINFACQQSWKLNIINQATIIILSNYSMISIPESYLVDPSIISLYYAMKIFSIIISFGSFISLIITYSQSYKINSYIINSIFISMFAVLFTNYQLLNFIFKLILWIIKLLIENNYLAIYVCIFWTILIIITIYIASQVSNVWSNTATRKIFHFLSVIMFVPILLIKSLQSFLIIAIGLILSLFILIEIIRLLLQTNNIYNLNIITKYYKQFIDIKDNSNGMILSQFYLLLGCFISILYWILLSNISIQLNYSNNLNHSINSIIITQNNYSNLSFIRHFGWITVGIGDAMSAIYGKNYGKMKYYQSNKTYEGSFAAFISMLFVSIIILIIEENTINLMKLFIIIISLFVTTIAEAFTNENDNIIMPMVSCIIYLFIWLFIDLKS